MANSVDSVEQTHAEPPALIEYTNIIHKFGVDSAEAENFKNANIHDALFQKRAKILDTLKKEHEAGNISISKSPEKAD